MAKLTDKQLEFLQQPYYGVVTTLRPDGSPHSTVVWVDVVDGKPSFNTAYPRVKPANLENDPRASLVVIDPNDNYRWLSVDGHVELTTEGANEQIDKLARKYTEHESYPWHKDNETRVSVTLTPDHVTAVEID